MKNKKLKEIITISIDDVGIENIITAYNQAEEIDEGCIDSRSLNIEINAEDGKIKEAWLHSTYTMHDSNKVDL